MGTGRVVPPSHWCPPPDISQNWGSKKGERTESPTRYAPCARGRAPHVQDLVVEDVLTRSRWVQDQVKMGTGRVVPPSHRCPPPDTSQDWGSKKGERTESLTRYVPCAWGRAPHVQDLVVEDVLTRSRWVQGG